LLNFIIIIEGKNLLFALIFSYIFLRDVERVNHQAIIATLLIVSGITLVTL